MARVTRKLKITIAVFGLLAAIVAGWSVYESIYGEAFCVLGERVQNETTRWRWPNLTESRSREQLLRDEISCSCTQGSDSSTDCPDAYPIPEGTTIETLEEEANYYSYMGGQTKKSQCMLKKGYAPEIHKKWVCYWHHV